MVVEAEGNFVYSEGSGRKIGVTGVSKESSYALVKSHTIA